MIQFSPSQLVDEIISSWRGGQSPDALAVIRRHPELESDKSQVLSLAYEEYCLRREAGEPVVASTFCNQFPTHRHSLRRLLDVHEGLGVSSQHSQLPEDIAWPGPGDCFLGCELLAELGRGALARVFLARQLRLGQRLVAMKVSPWGGTEAATLGRLTHPHIVPVLSVEEDADRGLMAVCMPYTTSTTLLDFLDAAFAHGQPRFGAPILRALDPSAANTNEPAPRVWRRGTYVEGVVDLAIQLADALDYAHRQGVRHGDLKPPNVLVTRSGQAFLLDFNLSQDRALTACRIGGTLPYMAPEQLQAVFQPDMSRPNEVDARSDIYSLGAMIYQLLAGALPWDCLPAPTSLDEMVDGRLAATRRPPQSLKQLNPDVDAYLQKIVERCLAYDPQDRPASAARLRAQLQAHASVKRRWLRKASRHRRAVTGLLSLTAVLLAGAGWHMSHRPGEAERLWGAGLRYLEAGDRDKALDRFNFALELVPQSHILRFVRARTLIEAGRATAALSDLERLLAETQGDPRIGGWLAYAYCLAGVDGNALMQGYRLATDGTASAAVHNNQAVELQRLDGLLPQARSHLDQAIALAPQLWQAFVNRALNESLQAQQPNPKFGAAYWHQAAIRDIEAAVQLRPDDGAICVQAALVYAYAGRQDRAHLERARYFLQLASQHHITVSPSDLSSLRLTLGPDAATELAKTPAGNESSLAAGLLVVPPEPAFDAFGS